MTATATNIDLSPTAGPAVGSILNGFLVAAPRSQGTVALLKFDGRFSNPSDMACSGACLGTHLPRVISNSGRWAGLTWSSSGTTLHDVAPGGVPVVGPGAGLSCTTTVNGDVLHGPDASVRITGCTMGFALDRGGTQVRGSSDTREVRANQNERGEAWLAYATASSVLVARLDQVTLQPDNATPAVVSTLLTGMTLDVAPDGTWFLAGISAVGGGTQVYFGRVDGGAQPLALPTPLLPVATMSAPLGLAVNEDFAVLAYQSNPQGVSRQPWARDGGWQGTIRVSNSGFRPAIAADRTGFLVAWVEADQLKVAPLTCE